MSGSAEMVGTLKRLWRFPVKSMQGEEIDSAEVVWSGFYGNRIYALVDSQTSKLVSAKNPQKWVKVFQCSSRLLVGEEPAKVRRLGQPPVRIVLPGGEQFDVVDGQYGPAEGALSVLLGRQVRFAAAEAEPKVVEYEQYHPEIEEDPQRGRTTEFVRPLSSQAGTYTDKAAVHLLTVATLRALAELYPEGEFDPLRFRPNALVDTGHAKGFVEREWVGRTVAVGEEVELDVFAECGRCVMTTLRQPELADDTRILGTVMKYNRGKAGVFASVRKGGRVRRGDEVVVL